MEVLMSPINNTYANEVKLTNQELIDENIELLVEDGQLKDVVKDDKGESWYRNRL